MMNEKITHIDLFSGIGGFSLASDRVFGNVQHVFVEWDDFCQEVLKKHWPEAEYHKDINQFVADTRGQKQRGIPDSEREKIPKIGEVFILTGGFPCQPFSQAGRRKGTADDRYLWPPMLEAISIFKPEWVIAENVAGLVTWNNGLVLETVCSDLEREGYEVQPFVIPACAVQAPHRRDRVWIIANRNIGESRPRNVTESIKKKQPEFGTDDTIKNSISQRTHRGSKGGGQILESQISSFQTTRPDSQSGTSNAKRSGYKGNVNQARQSARYSGKPQWDTHWFEVATALCRVDDGIPRRLDKNPRLKALGNAIVPQVAEEIMRSIPR